MWYVSITFKLQDKKPGLFSFIIIFHLVACMSGRSPLIPTDLIHSSKTEFALELKIQFANTGATLSAAGVHERRRVSDRREENKFLICAKLQKRGFCEKPSERKETLRSNNPRLLHT